MEEYIKQFLKQDNINISKFIANSEIIENETKEIYQATAKLFNQKDINNNATETVFWVALIFNRPLGYNDWFVAAYPDVVKLISGLEEKKIISIIGNDTQNYMDNHHKLKLPILRKIVNAYKTINNLECC